MSVIRSILTEAEHLVDHEIDIVALQPNSKLPRFKNWQTTPRNTVFQILRESDNLGLRTGSVVALDFDQKGEAEKFAERYPSTISAVNVTKRGAHFLFSADGRDIRNAAGVTQQGLTYDVRGTNGFIVVPASQIDDFSYHWKTPLES